jgi:nucleotide-binding universal stress UspA family protein
MKGENIVIATDLSDDSGVAARWAHQLAETLGMRVVVTHVIAMSLSKWASGAYDILEDPANFQRAKERVRDWYEEHTGSQPDEVDLRVGNPVPELEASVEELDAAMLAVAMSGKGSMERILLGSTAQALAADPPCPVVIVHHGFERLQQPPRLAAGCDFSANSDRAIAYGAKLAKATESRLEIVHADTAPEFDFIEDADIDGAPGDEDHREWAREEMNDMKERLAAALADVEFDTHIVYDSPSRGLIGFAEENDSDVIIIGRSGQSELVGAILGSVMNTLLQTMPCTTVVVPLEDS